jgi:hypothetical protein
MFQRLCWLLQPALRFLPSLTPASHQHPLQVACPIYVSGAYLTQKIDKEIIDTSDTLVTTPDLANIFDQQYVKGMGFKNEKLLKEKKSGKYIFW